MPKVSDDEDWEVSLPNHTSIPLRILPDIFERVKSTAGKEQSSNIDDLKLQQLILEKAMDKRKFPSGSEERLFTEVFEEVTTKNPEYYKVISKGIPLSSEYQLASTLERYEEEWSSPANTAKRSYLSENHIWTPEEETKFQEALEKYGYGPTSNRLIAQYIGPKIHPNHVVRYKQQLKKVPRTNDTSC